VIASAAAAGRATLLHAAAPLATIAAGQTFDAPLQIMPDSADAASCGRVGLDELNTMTVQFAFSRTADGLAIAASRSNLSAPAAIAPLGFPGDASVPVAGDGTFKQLSITIDRGQMLTVESGQIVVEQTDAAGRASVLLFAALKGSMQIVAGDQVFYCGLGAALTAVPDTTLPLVFIPGCSYSDGAVTVPCLLLADQAVEIDFSEPVQVGGIAALISAVDANRNELALSPVRGGVQTAVFLSGGWPLGGTVTLTVAAGVPDRAGNTSVAPVSQTFAVVADPGDLDLAGNSGFETGDFSGYSLTNTYSVPVGSDQGSGVSALTSDSADPRSFTRIVTELHGVLPTEGGLMAAIGADQGCAAQDVDLTASFAVPDGVSALLIDANLLTQHTGVSGTNPPPFVSATVRGAGVLFSGVAATPSDAALLPADGSVMQSGWQQVSVNVGELAGQQVALTIHVYAARSPGFPEPCLPGTVLLDNLRFA
jgi:hypothetical protein